MAGLNLNIGYSILFIEYVMIDEKMKIMGQFPLGEGTDHKDRLVIASENGISNFSFYIMFNPDWIDDSKHNCFIGMDRGGYTWFYFDKKTFDVIKVHSCHAI